MVLSLCTGIRTEEARALRWEHVDFGDPDSVPPRVRERRGLEVGTRKRRHEDDASRRTLGVPQLAVAALEALHASAEPEPGTWCSILPRGGYWTRRTSGVIPGGL